MTGNRIRQCFVVVVLLVTACTQGHEQPLRGKWILESEIVGSSPTSYWFQENGKVVAPWEERVSQLRSSGKYELIGDNHIKIIMKEGPFRGITFFFEILTLTEDKLVLRGSIQDVHLKRVKE